MHLGGQKVWLENRKLLELITHVMQPPGAFLQGSNVILQSLCVIRQNIPII
jgi:hypothetical protein